MRFILALIAASAFAMSPALAQDSGFYMGAGFGETSIEVNDLEDVGLKFDDSGTTWKILGGYRFMKYFGAELEYIDVGDAEDSFREEDGTDFIEADVTIGLNGWNASAIGIVPLGEKFSLFGKLGFLMWDADFELDVDTNVPGLDPDELSGKGTDDGNDLSWGFGGGFDFTDNFGVRVEYQSFEIEDTDVALLSASALWKF